MFITRINYAKLKSVKYILLIKIKPKAAMKNVLLISSILFLYIGRIEAQKNDVLTRVPYTLKMIVDDSTFYEEKINAVPYIFPNRSLQMYPGEKIFLEVELKNNEIADMKPVKENENPSRTLILEFIQHTENNVHKRMSLVVTNPFPSTLTYKAKIFPLSVKNWVSTSIYPVSPGLLGIELWPDLITSIALGDWKFKAEK
ncbi:MAG: hypothetical protein ABWZ25_18030 [Chitinophagaceae bacterium]